MSVLAEATDIPYPGDRRAGRTEAQQDTQKFAEAAIADSKRQGLLLSVRARWVALAVIAVTLPIINPNWDVIYYVVMLGLFAVIGWAQLKVGTVGRSVPRFAGVDDSVSSACSSCCVLRRPSRASAGIGCSSIA